MDKNTQRDCIENYNVKYLIGRGSFGNVYKASIALTGQEVAIKFIGKKHLSCHTGLKTRVLQEVAIHSRLKHPSILELFSYFEDDHYIYLVLDLCQNGDLNSKLKHSPHFFTQDNVKKFMSQLVEGLLYLQRHRILHRDLTLSNLLLDKHLNIKICDFGLATRLEEPDEKHFTMCGTPNYISPEIASRRAHGLESDVWSVGCLLYTMVVGSPPFDSRQGVKKTLDNVIHAGLRVPDTVSGDVRDLITCMLVKHPDQRIKLEDIVKHPFFQDSAPLSRHKKPLVMLQTSMDSGSGTLSTIHNNSNNYNNNSRNNSNNHSKSKTNKKKNKNNDKENIFHENNNNNNHNNKVVNTCKSYDDGIGQSTVLSTNYIQEPLTLQKLLSNQNENINNYKANNNNNNNNNKGGCLKDILKPVLKLSSNPSKPPSSLLNQAFNQNRPRSRSVEQTAKKSRVLNEVNSYKIKNNSNNNTHNNNSNNNNNLLNGNLNGFHQSMSNVNNFNNTNNKNDKLNNNNNNTIMNTKPESFSTGNGRSVSKVDLNNNIGPPLNARRLIPIRQKTRNAVVNILKDGWVCVEFTKCFAADDYVTEVLFVSSDGIQVLVVNCSNGKEMRLKADQPVLTRACLHQHYHHLYTHPRIPSKYAKKYQYALRFVNLVRSKTPKITIYTGRAKVMLMENQGDFEAHFYDNTKVTISNTGTRIVASDGGVVVVQATASLSSLSPLLQTAWTYACDLQDKCIKLESLLESFHTDVISSPSSSLSSSSLVMDSCFPIIIGRRPTNPSVNNNVDHNNNNINNNDKNNNNNFLANSFNPSSNSTSFSLKDSPLSVKSYSGSEVSSSARPQAPLQGNSNSSSNNKAFPLTSNNVNQSPTNEICNGDNNNSVNNISSSCNNLGIANTGGQRLKTLHSRHLHLPNVGNAYQYPNGLITIKHQNGCLATVNSNTLDVSIATETGEVYSYSSSDQIPARFNPLLQHLPFIISSFLNT